MSRRRPVVGGNWKMNLDRAGSVALARRVADGAAAWRDRCEVAIFPAFPHLAPVVDALRGSARRDLRVGAQDVWPEPDGAFTGEVSTAMLRDLDVDLVIVGHSERRHVVGEGDALVARKLRAALAAGLGAVLCVGETLPERESGRAESVATGQLRAGLAGVAREALARVVVAYEPVWAIGTGRTASPDDAQAMHRVLREALAALYDDRSAEATRIQYGGSVKPGNAADLIARDDVDGFLVGGASLEAADFLAIVETAARAAESGSTHSCPSGSRS
jgi:triosephosphate isomerase